MPSRASMNLEKIYTSPDLIDLLISNNFSPMTFFCATRILRHYELSVVKVYDSQPIFLLIFWHNKKKQVASGGVISRT